MASANGTDRIGGLRDARRRAGLTQESVARAAGCSTSYVRLLEGGYAPATSHTLGVVQQVVAAALLNPTKTNGAPVRTPLENSEKPDVTIIAARPLGS